MEITTGMRERIQSLPLDHLRAALLRGDAVFQAAVGITFRRFH